MSEIRQLKTIERDIGIGENAECADTNCWRVPNHSDTMHDWPGNDLHEGQHSSKKNIKFGEMLNPIPKLQDRCETFKVSLGGCLFSSGAPTLISAHFFHP
jgi:GTP-dependent phosphoenolpyruvate carboxykinase